jgi:hypothetical protein
MDPNTLGIVRSGKPMPTQQQVPNRYPSLNSYYNQSSPVSYQQQSQVPVPPHRSLSMNTTPGYPGPPTAMSSNGSMNKSNLIDSIELKTEDTFDDPSKLQPSQQQMFHPLLQSRPRPQTTPYYPNNAYYSSQRPLTPSSDYNMSVARAIRPSAPYGSLPVQQRVLSSTSDPMTSMNNNPMGFQSTPPPPSVTPR